MTQQGPHPSSHFTLYSRSYCHLCEDMLAALRAFMARSGLPLHVDVVDVDTDPQLTDIFDELVPVLYAGVARLDGAEQSAGAAGEAAEVGPAGQEICHYFLDEAALQRYLAQHHG
ncbi:glutaredoxin family protein [Herbaspirillum sp. SJZ107]|uniref:glutaredoxin family protein n=1 Tax=Herbaspirillum sp. SJZ107 TaxID=2572881 RepID=UPI00116774F2|nr:glutaredoxin family protein [Herbaspirillum sp. SJZ107]TQK08215.1 glutaredoxin-like protein DUF836 [Herbaspirillum sp. SJZ107]